MTGRGRGVNNAPAWMTKAGLSKEFVLGRKRSRSKSPPSSSAATAPLTQTQQNVSEQNNPDPYGRQRPLDGIHGNDSSDGTSNNNRGRGGYHNDNNPYPPRDRDGVRYNHHGYRDHRGGPPPSRGRDYGYHDNRRRDPRDSYRNNRRGRPPHHNTNGMTHPKNESIKFNSFQEEREWLEERRRKRIHRKSLFDIPPTAEQLEIEAAQASISMMTVVGNKLPQNGMYNGFNNASYRNARAGTAAGNEPYISGGNTPQHTRHARRLYIGQLPLEVNEHEVHDFFKDCIRIATNKEQHEFERDEDPILSVYINRERRFAFLEFRAMDMCTACLALDGINVLGKGKVKIKRPNDYNPTLCSPADLAAHSIPFDVSRLGIVSSSVTDGPNKIFIGGLPYHLTEDQVMELLGAFGQLKAFHLVKQDATAMTSKGYCFVEYADPNVTAVAVMGLNGMAMGSGKVLSARMAAARTSATTAGEIMMTADSTGAFPTSAAGASTTMNSAQQHQIEQEEAKARMQSTTTVVNGIDVESLLSTAMGAGGGAMAATANVSSAQPSMMMSASDPNAASAALDFAFGGGGTSATTHQAAVPSSQQQQKTRIIVLLNMVMDEDLATEQDYRDLFEEVQEECQKFGKLVSMKIPRPSDGYPSSTCIKKIFLEYATQTDAINAESQLSGRAFGPNIVQTEYLSEEDFKNNQLK